MTDISRRDALKGFGTVAAGSALGAVLPTALAAPAIAQGSVLTVSTWGGVTQDSIRTFVEPEFRRLTGASLAFDIGGQGARYNKLLAQRANPPADVFYSADEAVVSGHKAGILIPARRVNLPNLADVSATTLTADAGMPEGTVAGAPYAVIAYVLGYNPDLVSEPVTSWADMWRPEFQGKLAFISPTHSQMPAFVIMAAELAGGSAENPDPGFAKLAELRPARLTVFWTDWAPLNKSGDVTIGTEFDYYFETMKAQDYPIEYVIPDEGGFAAAQYVSIVAGTPNQELAEAFLNLVLDPKVQTDNATETFQGPTNTTVSLPDEVMARCSCGARLDQLRFSDPELFGRVRAAWTERLNIEVVPQWGAR